MAVVVDLVVRVTVDDLRDDVGVEACGSMPI
jgi:hypothetical protein